MRITVGACRTVLRFWCLYINRRPCRACRKFPDGRCDDIEYLVYNYRSTSVVYGLHLYAAILRVDTDHTSSDIVAVTYIHVAVNVWETVALHQSRAFQHIVQHVL